MADNTGLFGDGMMGGYGNNITAANILRSRYRQPIAQAAMENADTGSIRATPPTPFESWLNESGQRLMNPTDTIAQGVQNFTQQDPVDMGMSLLNGGMGGALGATVWHGSPHKFDKFDFSKIGTGEGAQAYGHGGYLADARQVGEMYRDKLSKNVTVDGSKLSSVPSDSPLATAHNQVATSIANGMTPEAAIIHVANEWDSAAKDMLGYAQDNPELADQIAQEAGRHTSIADAARTLKSESFFKDPGYLYKIDLPDEHIAKMLDWDKPLSEQHPDVQAALQPMIDRASKSLPHIRDTPDMTGASIYQASQAHRGGNPEEVSAAMQQAGIPGIKYLDGGSRSKPMSASALSANKIYDDLMGSPGTSNYVVFPGNEDMLTILERNNQPLVNALRSK